LVFMVNAMLFQAIEERDLIIVFDGLTAV